MAIPAAFYYLLVFITSFHLLPSQGYFKRYDTILQPVVDQS
jgi:hypothetical protein